MKPWRDRGVVQDSDDEEQDLELLEPEGIERAERGGNEENGAERVELGSEPSDTGPKEDDGATTIPSAREVTTGVDGTLSIKTADGGLKAHTRDDAESRASLANTTTHTPHGTATLDEDDLDELQDEGLSTHAFKVSQPPLIAENSLEHHSQDSEAIDIFDILSSGLSSPPDSPIRRPLTPRQLPTPGPTTRPQSKVIIDVRPTQPSRNLVSPETLREAVSGRPGRNFRQRNPIQLHPYLLESEQYRRSLHARGLQPVSVNSHRITDVGNKEVESPVSSSGKGSPHIKCLRTCIANATNVVTPLDLMHKIPAEQ